MVSVADFKMCAVDDTTETQMVPRRSDYCKNIYTIFAQKSIALPNLRIAVYITNVLEGMISCETL